MKAAEILRKGKVITDAHYAQVQAQVENSGERSEEVMLDAGVVNEADLLKALSAAYQTQFVSTEKLSKAEVPKATLLMIPRKVAETLCVFPVMFDTNRNTLSIVTADPDDEDLLKEVELVSGAHKVRAFVTRPAAISAAILKHHAADGRAFGALDRSVMGGMGGNMSALDPHMIGIGTGRADTPPKPSVPPPRPPPPPASSHGIPLQALGAAPQAPAHVVQAQMQQMLAPGMVPGMQPQPMMQPGMGYSIPQNALQPLQSTMQQPMMQQPMMQQPMMQQPMMQQPMMQQPMVQQPMVQQPMVQQEPARPDARSSTQFGRKDSGLHKQLAVANEKVRDTTVELLTIMVSLLENSRQDLRGHSAQVARLIKRISERMKLDKDVAYGLNIACFVHDLGKMGQFHLTALNVAEYEGHRIAAQKSQDTPLRLMESVNLPQATKDAVFHMYERFDGGGFPDNLVGKEIPLGARVLALADTYADLTQNPRNPFRKTLGPQEAIGVLEKNQGTVFDPGLVELFRSIVLGDGLRNKLVSRYNVLIIDGDPEETTVLDIRMVEQGFETRIVRNVESAKKALKEAGEEPYDLVVSELDLSDGSGLDLLEAIRKEPYGRDLAWVFHTSRQGGKEAQRAFRSGALDFVTKPISSEILVAKLKVLLDQRSIARGTGGVSGSLREMGLADLVQVLFNGRKTGKLVVRSGADMGEIFFASGDVVHATLGNSKGVDAFFAMFKFQDGEFSMDPSGQPPSRTIADSTEALLLEGMRRLDEGI
jgi:response regulator RpfG family c-di-GMP phosphodiesterase